MRHKDRAIAFVIIGGLFLFLDQYLKYLARTNPFFDWVRLNGRLGWDYFENPGVAFGLAIPNTLIIIITPIILLGLTWWYGRKKQSLCRTVGFTLLIFGALSNYIDRIFFAVTIDYLRMFTSIINLADIMIVCGAGLLLLCEIRKPSAAQD